MISALSILSRLVLWVLEDVKKPTLREFQEPLEVSGYITVQVQYIFSAYEGRDYRFTCTSCRI